MNNRFKSIRSKLFVTLCIVILIVISFLIIVNNIVLETVYFYSKKEALMDIYEDINNYYNSSKSDFINFDLELEKMALNNNFDIIIRDKNDNNIYVSNKDFLDTFGEMNEIRYKVSYNIFNKDNIMYSDEAKTIRKIQDKKTGLSFIFLSSQLDCGHKLYIRIAISPIKDSIQISNKLLYIIAGLSILIGGIVISVITEKFANPIIELNDMANKMSKLDFSKKYRITDSKDEVNELGRSMNLVSDKLESTIKQLRKNNMELERDIEEKSKIDEMRKQFISDVSHELKTPIALIQGYAEGLIENVNTDEESKNFYSEVILDEANKMDKLVKQLLELMKLEYDNREFDNKDIDIVELIKEVIRKTSVMIEDGNFKVEFNVKKPIYIYADDFYIDQVVTNYITNAIKNVEEINGKKQIKVEVNKIKDDKVRVSVFNTGKNIDEDKIERIWTRFYKLDESRDRQKGGSGIGLSIVKAIMNRYGQNYGVMNKKDGVEFYFDCLNAKNIK